MVPALIARAEAWPERVAVVECGGSTSYARLLAASATAGRRLLDGRPDLGGARVAFLLPPGADHVVAQWAIWRSGGVAVPLSSRQVPAEWEYVVGDTGAETIVAGGEAEDALRSIGVARGARFVPAAALTEPRPDVPLPDVLASRDAMILYTSGTTGRPKGVVTTHANIEAQVRALVEAWGWSPDDRVLHVLPMNHVHGIVNLLACALWSGAACEFRPFRPVETWDRLEAGGVTVFMAVPTIYAKLLAAWDGSTPEVRRAWSRGAARLRLMVSGSAALPVTVLERWQAATGHVLLERYGMTEFGMALSNPLHGERRAGTVGVPLPGVEVRLVDERGARVRDGEPGEIEVRGPGVFRGYWHRDEETRASFRDGWFRTGDVATVDRGYYRILGRRSVDIIKTGGFKVSALEIEDVLRGCPAVRECAVVGVPDEEWGERVAVAVEPGAGDEVTLDELRAWAADRLASYKLPTRLVCLRALPRNAMGKVLKTRVKALFG
jgi:malonyl-CoA/methylmalonyl-CoA synthetase